MSQNDYVIANATAPAFRADLNLALQALASQSSGATAPSTIYANMIWYDTANNLLKMRSEANDAWITIGTLDQSTNTFAPGANTSGTWTPIWTDTGGTAFGATYSLNTGVWVRHGDMMWVQGEIVTTSMNGKLGSVSIGGLPMASLHNGGISVGFITNMAASASFNPIIATFAGSTLLSVRDSSPKFDGNYYGNESLTSFDVTDNGKIEFSGWIKVA